MWSQGRQVSVSLCNGGVCRGVLRTVSSDVSYVCCARVPGTVSTSRAGMGRRVTWSLYTLSTAGLCVDMCTNDGRGSSGKWCMCVCPCAHRPAVCLLTFATDKPRRNPNLPPLLCRHAVCVQHQDFQCRRYIDTQGCSISLHQSLMSRAVEGHVTVHTHHTQLSTQMVVM